MKIPLPLLKRRADRHHNHPPRKVRPGTGPELQHEFDDIVAQYHHTHLSGKTCLEIMVVKGDSARFKELIDGLKANRHVTQLKYFIK